MSAGCSSIENELKLSITRADLEKVLKVFAKKEETSSIKHKFRPRYYYDTRNLELCASDISLRVQYKEGAQGKLGRYEQTVKITTGLPQGNVFERKECKDTVEGYAPDIAHVSDKDAKKALKPFQGKELVHIFTAAVERRMINLKLPQGKVEVAFDVGRLMLADGMTHTDLVEIEIEPKGIEAEDGGQRLIQAIKKEIMALAPSAHVQTLSKAQLGTQLYSKAQAALTR